MVEYLVLHKDSYLGGEYDAAGGYDILAIKVFKDQQHLSGHEHLYLPGKAFR